MLMTKALYEDRKNEINFYFQVLYDVMAHEPDTDNSNSERQRLRAMIQTEDNNRFIRIMKSNFLLMLYNLIESCVKKGFEEIYEVLIAENVSYVQASCALRDIWSSYEISKAEQDNAVETTYGTRVKAILEQVISSAPITLSKKVIEKMASGNLDARKIRELFDKHNISFIETNAGEKGWILRVKTKRNSLAHGDESFDEAARNLTLEDLNNIRNEVLVFIEDAINGIDSYYSNRLYLTSE